MNTAQDVLAFLRDLEQIHRSLAEPAGERAIEHIRKGNRLEAFFTLRGSKLHDDKAQWYRELIAELEEKINRDNHPAK